MKIIHKQKRGGIGWHHLCDGKHNSPKDAVWNWEGVTCSACIALRVEIRSNKGQVIDRIRHSMKLGAQKDLIADFRVYDAGKFDLLGCDLRLYSGDLNLFPWFESASIGTLKHYRIDHYGSYVHWFVQDIHMDFLALVSGIRKTLK